MRNYFGRFMEGSAFVANGMSYKSEADAEKRANPIALESGKRVLSASEVFYGGKVAYAAGVGFFRADEVTF